MSRDRVNLQHQAEHTCSRRRPSVLGYLAILFAAAFLMLLMAYFQQQRQNDQTTDALNKSVSAVQSIQNVMDENQSLNEENAALKAQLEALTREMADLTARLDSLEADHAQAQAQAQAMQWFWQIDEAYAKGKYRLCRELIEQFQAHSALVEALSGENITGTDRFSPKARYQEIYDALY